MFPPPKQLREMIEQATRDRGLPFKSEPERRFFVNKRAEAAEQQFRTAMTEVPEELIQERNRMQRQDPMGAVQWQTRYESAQAEIALAQALEMPTPGDVLREQEKPPPPATTSPPSGVSPARDPGATPPAAT
jgi:hypothetical protein